MKDYALQVIMVLAVLVFVLAYLPGASKSPNITNAEKLCRDNLKLDVKNVSVFKNRIIIICEDGKK